MFEILKSKINLIVKLFVFQIAMSLLGLFVVSPFSGNMQIAAGVFSTLFYFSLVCYAVIEDGQKDHLAVKSGRAVGNPYTGFLYSAVSYIPTIILVLFQMILFLMTQNSSITGLKAVLAFVIRFFLMGMYLGIDTGLAGRYYDSASQSMKSDANPTLLFMSDNYIIFSIFLVLLPLICGFAYMLAYKGKIHVNTEVKSKK